MRKQIIAAPLLNGKLCGHFGSAEAFAFVTVENNHAVQTEIFDAPEHQHGAFPPWIAEKGTTDVIAGSIGTMGIELFKKLNINVHCGATELELNLLIQLFLKGELEFSEEICRKNHHHHGHDH